MSNKMVLYPDHFVGPCVNHLGAKAYTKNEKGKFPFQSRERERLHVGMGMIQNNQIIKNYVF
jgi:hypothetical protein